MAGYSDRWNQALIVGAVTRVKLQNILDKLAETEDLTGQQMVVLLALHNDGISSVGEISETFLLKQTNVSLLIKKLESNDLLTRQRNDEDIRIMDLFLTEKGNQKVKRLMERIDTSYKKLVQDDNVHFEFEELKRSFLEISQIIDYLYKQEF